MMLWDRSQTVSQPAAIGRPMRGRTIGPASSGLREVLAGRDVLVPSSSSNSLCLAGRMLADFGRQLYCVPFDTLVRLASGLSEQCVKKQCGLAGSCFREHVALNLCLSLALRGVAAMGQDCNYQMG